MRKSIISLTLVLGLVLCGCTTPAVTETPEPTAAMFVEDGAYNLTPQELIDQLNSFIDYQGDSRYYQIPDYTTSGGDICIESGKIIQGNNVTLQLFENNSGNLSKVVVEWEEWEPTLESRNTYNAIVTFLISAICPENGERNQVLDRLDMDASGTPKYTTTASSNGTQFTYEYTLKGMYTYLTVEPAE